MLFETTAELLKEMESFTPNAAVTVTSDEASDFVSIDKGNHVGFKVLENEIIFFYFSDHHHFEDYTSQLAEGSENYIERAKVFLRELLTYQIRHVERYMGNALASESYDLMYHDGREDERIGHVWYGCVTFLIPFRKKTVRSTTWQFDRAKGIFTNRKPKNPSPYAVEVIDVNEDCYIEIFCAHGTYSYHITEIAYDEYFGQYFWTPAIGVAASGIYDTKEKAIYYAREAIRCREVDQL